MTLLALAPFLLLIYLGVEIILIAIQHKSRPTPNGTAKSTGKGTK